MNYGFPFAFPLKPSQKRVPSEKHIAVWNHTLDVTKRTAGSSALCLKANLLPENDAQIPHALRR